MSGRYYLGYSDQVGNGCCGCLFLLGLVLLFLLLLGSC